MSRGISCVSQRHKTTISKTNTSPFPTVYSRRPCHPVGTAHRATAISRHSHEQTISKGHTRPLSQCCIEVTRPGPRYAVDYLNAHHTHAFHAQHLERAVVCRTASLIRVQGCFSCHEHDQQPAAFPRTVRPPPPILPLLLLAPLGPPGPPLLLLLLLFLLVFLLLLLLLTPSSSFSSTSSTSFFTSSSVYATEAPRKLDAKPEVNSCACRALVTCLTASCPGHGILAWATWTSMASGGLRSRTDSFLVLFVMESSTHYCMRVRGDDGHVS